MGNLECCGSSSIQSEDYLSLIYQHETFLLKNFNNNKLLNKLVDVRINQELHKKYIEEKVIPLFYDKTDNHYEKYHTELFKHILFFLKPKNNMYEVLIYFYPFIDHTDEDVAKTFYSFVKYIYGSTTLKNILELLTKYLIFTTREINNVLITCEDKYSNTFREYNETIFNDENINNFIAMKMFELLKRYGENEIVECEQFEKLMNKVNLGSLYKIRQAFIYEFGNR